MGDLHLDGSAIRSPDQPAGRLRLLLDFSDPLEEQDWAEWLDIQNVVDPDLDEYDDIDLERFGPDGLLCFKTFSAEDGAPGTFTIPAEQVLWLAQEKKTTYKERE